jgi:predicted GIY-YIG superfamily endonuclease
VTETSRIIAEIEEIQPPNDGALLYVGITKDLGTRLKSHNRKKDWFTDVASVSLEHFASRDAVEVAERAAIANEHPRWNIVHKQAKGATLDDVVRAYDAIELAVENYRQMLRQSLASGVVRQSEVAAALGRSREMIRRDVMTDKDREVIASRDADRKRQLRSVA